MTLCPKQTLFFHKILSIQKTNEQSVHWPQYLSNLKCWKIVRNCVTKRCSALKMNRCARPLQFTKSRIHTFSCKHTTYKGKVLLFREAWWVTGHVQTVWVRVCLFVHSRTSVTSMRLKWGWWSLSQHLKREGNTFNLWWNIASTHTQVTFPFLTKASKLLLDFKEIKCQSVYDQNCIMASKFESTLESHGVIQYLKFAI